MELPFDPEIPLLGLYPKNSETPIQETLCTPMFIEAPFTIAKCWKQPQIPFKFQKKKKEDFALDNGTSGLWVPLNAEK